MLFEFFKYLKYFLSYHNFCGPFLPPRLDRAPGHLHRCTAYHVQSPLFFTIHETSHPKFIIWFYIVGIMSILDFRVICHLEKKLRMIEIGDLFKIEMLDLAKFFSAIFR